ncbi:MAG TPA: ERAP1-like C-terminal domain-containing protein, partial [Geminicoccaceae bacterium]
RMTRVLVDRYLTAESRPAALAMIAMACERLLAVARPGGSRQLAAARGLISAGVDTGRLRGWLSGRDVPAGLAVDTDLRWRAVHRLAVLGEAGPGDIIEELLRDRSAAGEQWAARCRAARPDAAAKQAAWDAFIADESLSNRLVEANAQGFWQPEQIELTRPYVERYFEDMPEMARRRSTWIAERVAAEAYPHLAVEPRTRQLAAQLLARPDLPPSLRRAVADADDDLARALAART